jgi:hypothetical protein
MHFNYDSVRKVGYEPSIFIDDALISRVQLNNIEILTLQLPIDDRFFSIIPNLENLFSLNVYIYTRNYQTQFQNLLDHAPRLFSLAFGSCYTSEMPPYQYTSSSVRRLDLHGFDKSSRQHYTYDRKQCMELSRSSLGIQCRVLIIEVQEAESIGELIYSMINLRTLEVSYEHDKRGNQYDLVELIQNCLPSTWVVTRSCYGHLFIRSC